MVSPGYAPLEQYNNNSKRLGPWTDIYALAGVIYRVVSGKVPTNATDRISAQLQQEPDPLPSAVGIGGDDYARAFLDAVDGAMSVLEKDRPQSIRDWRNILLGKDHYVATVQEHMAQLPVIESADKATIIGMQQEENDDLVGGSLGAKLSYENYSGFMFPGVEDICGSQHHNTDDIEKKKKKTVQTGLAAINLAIDVKSFGLTINTHPEDAYIKVKGYDEPYQAGMQLVRGEYAILVRKALYKTVEQKVRIIDSDVELFIEMNRK